MNSDAVGPVESAEVQAVVAHLAAMSARAAEHGQGMFHFVLAMAAESLADNLDVAEEEAGNGPYLD